MKEDNKNNGIVNVNKATLSNINTQIKNFNYISGTTISTLILPGAGFRMSIPNSFFTINQKDIEKYQPNTLSYWYDCGLFYKDAVNSTGFYISFVPLGPCASEKMYSTINDAILQGSISDLCDRLKNHSKFSGCSIIANPPSGFQEVSYYEYVPAYGYDGIGTIVKTYYLQESRGEKLLISFIPDTNNQSNVKETDLKATFAEISNGFSLKWNNVQDQVSTVGGIIQSLEK